MGRRWNLAIPVMAVIVGVFSCVIAVQAQSGRPDDPVTPNGSTKGGSRPESDKGSRGPRGGSRSGASKAPILKPGKITIIVDPTDSIVLIDDQEFRIDPGTGAIITEVAPGNHTISVRRVGYSDAQRTLDIKTGENLTIPIMLEQLKGVLTVRPSVNGAQIEVWSIGRNQSVGSYVGYLNNVAFPPGDYDITVSKTGYQDSTRTVTLKAGGSVEIEPTLHPTPPPKPTPKPPPRPMNALVEIEGKYLIVHLSGTSADDSIRSGSINVTVSKNISGFPSVIGTLNGSPCRIEFFRQENIDQWSLIETPSPSNQYSRIVVRIKPKDSKRPASFVINWIAVNSSSQFLDGPAGRETLSEAVPISKVLPTVPAIVRSLNVQGVVSVSVVIDERGNVISAKALDGPAALRQPAEDAARRWKFRPATRNGIATQATQTIRFSFER